MCTLSLQPWPFPDYHPMTFVSLDIVQDENVKETESKSVTDCTCILFTHKVSKKCRTWRNSGIGLHILESEFPCNF